MICTYYLNFTFKLKYWNTNIIQLVTLHTILYFIQYYNTCIQYYVSYNIMLRTTLYYIQYYISYKLYYIQYHTTKHYFKFLFINFLFQIYLIILITYCSLHVFNSILLILGSFLQKRLLLLPWLIQVRGRP